MLYNPHRFRCPDDFHLHLREGSLLRAVLPSSARNFARALIMPNLRTPISNARQAALYRNEILSALEEIENRQDMEARLPFEPLMTIYLTEETTIADFVSESSEATEVFAGKLYFAGATTNAQHGVRDITRLYSLFERMEERDIPLSLHGEVGDADIDIYDREQVFIERQLEPLLRRFSSLRVTLEHISTALAVSFVREHNSHNTSRPRLGATITPHHLLLNRNDMLADGIRPHYYCKPLVKRESDREALVAAASSGEGCFFLGTDSAPHERGAKESACGCAGIFNAPYALDCVLAACEPQTAEDLRRIECFTSENGARFHALPLSESYFSIEQTSQPIAPSALAGLEGTSQFVTFVPPPRVGDGVSWRRITTAREHCNSVG